MRQFDVPALEARTPMPTSGEEKPQGKGDRIAPVDRIIERIQQGKELRAFEQAYGLDGQGSKDNGRDKSDLVTEPAQQLIKTQGELLTSLLTIMVKAQGQDGQPNQLTEFLIAELRDVKGKVDTPGPDPISVAVETSQKLKQLFGDPAERQSDPAVILQIHKMDLEKEQEITRRKLDVEEAITRREEMKADKEEEKADRAFDRNLKVIELEHNMKVTAASAEADGKRKGEGWAMAQDLGMSVINSIDTERAVEERPVEMRPRRSQAQERVRIPQSFTCEECEATIHNPDGQMTVTCPQCGTEYNMEEQTADGSGG